MSKKRFFDQNRVFEKAYIYYLQDPTHNDQRCYVGKTGNTLKKRIGSHISSAKNYKRQLDKEREQGITRDTYNYNYNWINSLLAKGIEPEIIEVCMFENITLSELNEIETWHIKQFKLLGIKLTNTGPGGYGGHGVGYIANEETKQKISASLKEYFANNEAPNKGKSPSAETREKLRQANLGKKYSPERCAQMSAASKGENAPFYGKKHTQETIAKMNGRYSDLVSDQVIEIKWLLVKGELTHKAIGEIYGAKDHTIDAIKVGKVWAHIKIYDENGNEIRTQDLKRKSARTPLNAAEIVEIERLLQENIGITEIARKFNIATKSIRKIKTGNYDKTRKLIPQSETQP